MRRDDRERIEASTEACRRPVDAAKSRAAAFSGNSWPLAVRFGAVGFKPSRVSGARSLLCAIASSGLCPVSPVFTTRVVDVLRTAS
jgi:hypothetical protein